MFIFRIKVQPFDCLIKAVVTFSPFILCDPGLIPGTGIGGHQVGRVSFPQVLWFPPMQNEIPWVPIRMIDLYKFYDFLRNWLEINLHGKKYTIYYKKCNHSWLAHVYSNNQVIVLSVNMLTGDIKLKKSNLCCARHCE